jgi:hypothetical protein
LYPRWNLTGRPALPDLLASADLVHATSAVAVPPAADRQRLVVTVHDLAFLAAPSYFPRQWRQVYRTGLRATLRRADAIVTPSRATAEDLLTRTKVDPSRVHVIPEAAALPESTSDPSETLARLKCRARTSSRRDARAQEEPRPADPRVPPGRDDRRPPRARAGGPLGWHRQALMRELALKGRATSCSPVA